RCWKSGRWKSPAHELPMRFRMSQPKASGSNHANEWRDREKVLQRFDQAWRSGTPPRIENYLSPSNDQELLVELVAMDLQYRWRSSKPGPLVAGLGLQRPWTLEDYVKHFPALGPLERLPAELIGEEYWARKCWGDQPSHTEYAGRFPRHGAKLK